MIGRLQACALALLLGLVTAQTQAQSALATTVKDGISYISGGIGIDEMQQLQAREKEFNVKLVFTLIEGNYVSDVAVVLKTASGKSLLALDAQGPIVLARLAQGSYVIDSTYHGQTQTRKIKVGDRLRTEYVRWPSDPDRDFPVRDTKR